MTIAICTRARNFRPQASMDGFMKSPISAGDPTFPPALLEMSDHALRPCRTLHVRGAWPPEPGIAVVGTRRATPKALAFTRDLAAAIVDAGWAVWSGGALGIDAAAHEGALACGGKTVVVCPSGLDVTYPPEHEALFREVVERGGTLVSPFADHEQAALARFHHRNDVLACLTLATIVVEAPLRSGARSTARAARALGRPILVVTHAPWDPFGHGCAIEIERGARPLTSMHATLASLVDLRPPRGQMSLLAEDPRPSRARAAHVSRAAHAVPASRARAAHASHARSEGETRVLDAISETPIHADDLCERTSLPFATVTAALLTLTLQAVVVEAPAGFYRRPSS